MDHAKVKILNFNKETRNSAPHYCKRCHIYFTQSRAYLYHLSTEHSNPAPEPRVITRSIQPINDTNKTQNKMASPNSVAPTLGDVKNVSFGETINVCANNTSCLRILLVNGFLMIGICKKDIIQCYICKRNVSEYAIARKMNLDTTCENSLHHRNNWLSGISQKVAADIRAAKAAIGQKMPIPKATYGQIFPIPKTTYGQKLLISKAEIGQKLPILKAVIGQNLPVPKAVIGQNLPIPKAVTGQNLPIPKAVTGQNLPIPKAVIGQNLPIPKAVLDQNLPIPKAIISQKPIPKAATGQNLPLPTAGNGKNLPFKVLPDVVPASEKKRPMEWQGGVESFSIPPPVPLIPHVHQISPLTFGINGVSNLVMQRMMPDESEAECVLGF